MTALHHLPTSSAPEVPAGGPVLVASGVGHVFGDGQDGVVALQNINLEVRSGEFVAVVGQSGCGKSTLLNILAGLLTPSFGQVDITEETSAADRSLPAVGYITQHDSLLPWCTVLDNAAFALEVHGVRRRQRREQARDLLARVGLLSFANRYPHELSGGMRQRLSLARTLVYEPRVLLMDEPFGALDAEMRGSLHDLLLELWAETATTILFVTHDLVEAITLADRVVTLSSRPGSVRNEHHVDIARPRDFESLQRDPRAGVLHRAIRADLTSHSRTHNPNQEQT